MFSDTYFYQLKDYLDFQVEKYNTPSFISTDPISIPHQFSIKQDIEIAGFLTAVIAWGNRRSILKSAQRMMELMEHSPYMFVMEHSPSDYLRLEGFVHRTFSDAHLVEFVRCLKRLYTLFPSMEDAFLACPAQNLQERIGVFKDFFFAQSELSSAHKHLSDPRKGSCAKRMNMLLRWLVRCDNKGVDLGIWQRISPSELSCPLDVHSGRAARSLGLISRKQNDAKALAQLDAALRLFDPTDPAKYDFALFAPLVEGMGLDF